MYIYNNGRAVLRSFNDMTAMISPFNSLLELKSTPWNDTFAYYSVIQGSYLKNPVEDLKLLVLNEGLEVDEFNYYMCIGLYSITAKNWILTR